MVAARAFKRLSSHPSQLYASMPATLGSFLINKMTTIQRPKFQSSSTAVTLDRYLVDAFILPTIQLFA